MPCIAAGTRAAGILSAEAAAYQQSGAGVRGWASLAQQLPEHRIYFEKLLPLPTRAMPEVA